MKKIIAMLLALVMVFALVACGSADKPEDKPVESDKPAQSQPAESNKPAEEVKPDPTPAPPTFDGEIVFGHIADLTGVEALTGGEAVAAMDFAVKLINQAGGIAGKEVKVIHEDSKSSTPEAKNAAQKLIENDKVVAILGPTQAGHKGSVGGLVTELKVPAVYYNATPFGMLKGNAYIISAGGGTSQLPTAMADYLYNDMGWRKVYTITQDNTGGQNYMNPFIDNFTAMGGEVIEAMWVAAGVSDLTSYLSKMTADADGIVGWLSNADGIKLWTTWYEMGLDMSLPMVSSMHGGFTDYYILDAIEQTSPEVVDAILECAIAPVAYTYEADNEVNKAFVEAWTKEFGSEPLATNLPGAIYGAMLLVKQAAEKIEGEITSEALYQAFLGCDVQSPEGHLAFSSDNRAAIKDIYIVKPVKTAAGYNYKILKTYKDVDPNGLKVG